MHVIVSDKRMRSTAFSLHFSLQNSHTKAYIHFILITWYQSLGEYQGLRAFPTIPWRDNDSFREEAPWDEAEGREEVPRKASTEKQRRRIVCHLQGFRGA